MKLTQMVWDKITITYDENIDEARGNKEIWRDAQLYFQQERDIATLWVRKGDKSLLLGDPKLIELTPWSAKFEAHWWESNRDNEGFKRFIRGEVVCEF